MLKRPQKHETEDDLLRQEEEYYKSQNKVPKTADVIVKTEEKKPIIGHVVERKPDGMFQRNESLVAEGFPKTFKIDKALPSSSKKSIFALSLEKKMKIKAENVSQTKPLSVMVKERNKIETIPPSILSGDDRDSIHQENLNKLSEMSVEEIMKEQKQLLTSLDSNLVEFLKNKRKKVESVNTNTDITVDTKNKPIEQQDMDVKMDIDTSSDIKIVDPELNKWLDIGVLEKEKLQWVGDIPDAKALQPDQPYSARFDFNGTLLPYFTPVDVTNALYHHGDEPERPGYTIQELYQLCRSSVLQQRIVAINTIAAILHKCKLGYYDLCFDGQLLQTLMDNDLFILLRFSLDENTDSIIAATVNCLHQFIYTAVDEVSLDKCLGIVGGFKQPLMSVPEQTKQEEEQELKDHVLLNVDFIKGILRSDLLVRFNYILTNLKPTQETIIQIIEILIRIARHSSESCKLIVQTSLLQYICENFILSSNPLHQAIKLIRIIFSHPNIYFFKLNISLEILTHKFISFIEIDNDLMTLSKEEIYKLKLESLALWQTFCFYGHTFEVLNSYDSNLIRILGFYFENIDFNDGQASFDFDLFTSIVMFLINAVENKKLDKIDQFSLMIYKIGEKWLTQLLFFKFYNFQMLKALGSIFQFCVVYLNTKDLNKTDLDDLKTIIQIGKKFLNSEIFSELCQNLKGHSVLLSHKSLNTNRNPKNLSSLNCMFINGEDYIRIIQKKSTLPFLSSFLNFLLKLFKINNNNIEFKTMINNKYLINYMNKIKNLNLIQIHWFYKFEINFISVYLECLYYLNNFDLKLAFKVISLIQNCEKNILNLMFEMIFDGKVWPQNEEMADCTGNLNQIASVYKNIYNVNNEQFLFSSGFTESFLPIDWIYSPIIYYHNKKEENTEVVILTLQFTYLVNCLNLAENLTDAAKYCRLATVFLSNSNAITDENIQKILSANFKMLLNNNNINFNEEILGISSFYNFYIDLISEYAAESYGNKLFAYFVLVPLQNKFDVSLRKLIWSEYLFVLKLIRITDIEEGFNIKIQQFYEPFETDYSLLVCYLNNIATKVFDDRKTPFIYNIAVNNLKYFMSKFEFKENDSYKIILNRVKTLKDESLKSVLMELI